MSRYNPSSNGGIFDSYVTSGLAGTSNSLAYRVHEIEKHLHSAGSWFEAAGTPSGETHVADRIGTVGGGGAFQLDAGNLTWGSWVQILGSTDTPARTSQLYFDPHEILIESTERTATYYIQFTRGDSGAAGLAAGTYTELVVGADTNRFKGITRVQTGRSPVGAKLWARTMCPGQNTATINFYIGIHEYAG